MVFEPGGETFQLQFERGPVRIVERGFGLLDRGQPQRIENIARGGVGLLLQFGTLGDLLQLAADLRE